MKLVSGFRKLCQGESIKIAFDCFGKENEFQDLIHIIVIMKEIARLIHNSEVFKHQ